MGIYGKTYDHHMAVSPGTYYWGGYFSHSWWIDSKEELIGLIINQQVAGSTPIAGFNNFKDLGQLT